MNEPQTPPAGVPAKETPVAKPAASRPAGSRLLSALQLPLAILITVAVLAYLLWPEGRVAEKSENTAPEVEIVKLIGQHCLAITAGTPLEKKLQVTPVVQQETKAPKLKVVGAVVARVPPPPVPKGEGKESPAPLNPLRKAEVTVAEGRWDFNTPDLASAYADWLKARADVPFYEKQLEDIRKLAEETLKAKKDVRDRLEKLVKAGTDPEKDLAAAKADYLQATAQSQKDEHEALTNVNNAKRTLATLERQLFQAGMDPDLLANPTPSTAIVAAEVPEGRIGLVEKGETCTAQILGLSGRFDLRHRPQSCAHDLQRASHAPRLLSAQRAPGTPEAGHVRRNQLGHRSPQYPPHSGRRRAARRPIRLCARADRGTRRGTQYSGSGLR